MEIVSIQDNDKLDQLFLLICNKTLKYLSDNISRLEIFILAQLENYIKDNTNYINDNKKKEILMNNYRDEFNEIKTIINNENGKIIQTILNKNLINAMSHSNLDTFLKCFINLSNIISIDDESSNRLYILFSKFESDYIFQFFEIKNKKITESVDCEDWNALSNPPNNYQTMINFIQNNNPMELRNITDRNKVLSLFEEEEKMTLSTVTDKNTIEINNKSFKLVICTLDIIKVVYDSLKMITILDRNLNDLIINNLIKILNNFLILNKELILDGEGCSKGKLKSISQKEVSIVCSNVNIVKNILFFISQYFNEEVFNDINQTIDKIIHTCKCKISDNYFRQR